MFQTSTTLSSSLLPPLFSRTLVEESPASCVWPKMTTSGLKRKIWSVYFQGDEIARQLSYNEALKLGKSTVMEYYRSDLPGKIKVQEYSIGESPLSQFGLNPKLHKQCNVFNMGEGACEECQGCKIWLNEEVLKAYSK